MQDRKKGGTEWIALGPEDIDETPCEVYIDPLSDANRMQKIQMLSQQNKEGYVPRRLVQEAMPEGDDPEAWDNEIALDSAEQMLFTQAIEEAMTIVRMSRMMGDPTQQQPQQPGAPVDPAAPNAPTVGAEQSAASQGGQAPGQTRPGPTLLSDQSMKAGGNQGYQPPVGAMTQGGGNG
jgi:hypothetical protein